MATGMTLHIVLYIMSVSKDIFIFMMGGCYVGSNDRTSNDFGRIRCVRTIVINMFNTF